MLISVPKYHNNLYSLLSILVLSKIERQMGDIWAADRMTISWLSNSDTFPIPAMTQISLGYFF